MNRLLAECRSRIQFIHVNVSKNCWISIFQVSADFFLFSFFVRLSFATLVEIPDRAAHAITVTGMGSVKIHAFLILSSLFQLVFGLWVFIPRNMRTEGRERGMGAIALASFVISAILRTEQASRFVSIVWVLGIRLLHAKARFAKKNDGALTCEADRGILETIEGWAGVLRTGATGGLFGAAYAFQVFLGIYGSKGATGIASQVAGSNLIDQLGMTALAFTFALLDRAFPQNATPASLYEDASLVFSRALRLLSVRRVERWNQRGQGRKKRI